MGKRVSLIYLVNQKKEILFQLRDNKPTIPWPNFWGLIGGEIENETPEEAIIRETIEEINYKLERINKICETTGIDQLTNKQNLLYFFTGNINLSLSEIRLNEGQRLSFFNPGEIAIRKIPPIIKKIFQENREKILYI